MCDNNGSKEEGEFQQAKKEEDGSIRCSSVPAIEGGSFEWEMDQSVFPECDMPWFQFIHAIGNEICR